MSVNLSRKEILHLFLFALIVLLSRLPFLSFGYGAEEDSWGIVRCVIQTEETNTYEPSRMPGHPVHEAIFLFSAYAGPWFYNGVSAIMSVIACLFFALSLRQLNFRNYILAGSALAFVPVIFISSTYTIDFACTLGFVMLSLYLILKKEFLWAGLFLGLAAGCRITSLGMLIPFFIIQTGLSPLRQNYQSLIKVTLPALFIAVLSYIPVLAVYGPGFFSYSDQFDYPPFTKIIYKASIGVFGSIGLLALLYSLFLMVRNKTEIKITMEDRVKRYLIWACLAAFIIYTISYLRLPQKSGYLIPVVPFVIIALGVLLNEKKFRIICFLLILSSFFFSVNLTDNKRGAVHSAAALRFTVSGQEIFIDPLTGPIYADITKRIQKMNFTSRVIAESKNKSDKFIVIAGWWYNEIIMTLREQGQLKLKEHFVFYATKEQLEDLAAEGNTLYYLPEQDIYNNGYSKMQGTATMAKPFINE